MPTKLYRPVGLEELALIWDSGCREFPPRLPDQPIFYPVTSSEYATKDHPRLEYEGIKLCGIRYVLQRQ